MQGPRVRFFVSAFAFVCSSLCNITFRFFVTGSYDAHLRVFDSSQNLVQTIPIHDGPITSICTLVSENESVGSHIIASSSHDMTAQLTSVSFATDSSYGKNGGSKSLASLHLHTSAVTSIVASSSSSHLLTTSRDHLIGVWDTRIPTEDEVPVTLDERERKRRKKSGDANASSNVPKRKAPLAVLKSHTGIVSSARFEGGDNAKTAYSCGLDSTIRSWDVEAGVCTGTMVRRFDCIRHFITQLWSRALLIGHSLM